MDDKITDKEQILEDKLNVTEPKDEASEVSDEELEGISGGSTPIISPYR